jgi:hypothetical protein
MLETPAGAVHTYSPGVSYKTVVVLVIVEGIILTADVVTVSILMIEKEPLPTSEYDTITMPEPPGAPP